MRPVTISGMKTCQASNFFLATRRSWRQRLVAWKFLRPSPLMITYLIDISFLFQAKEWNLWTKVNWAHRTKKPPTVVFSTFLLQEIPSCSDNSRNHNRPEKMGSVKLLRPLQPKKNLRTKTSTDQNCLTTSTSHRTTVLSSDAVASSLSSTQQQSFKPRLCSPSRITRCDQSNVSNIWARPSAAIVIFTQNVSLGKSKA